MHQLSEQTALITGAAGGIGRGIARALAARGARLVLVDTNESQLRETATELRARADVQEAIFDVRDRAEFAKAVDRCESEFGPVTILCNNAGIVFPEDVENLSFDLWDLSLGINLGGVINGIQTLLPRMISRAAPAHIVNTASIAGLGPGGGPMYTTGKYAVVGLSETLAERLDAAGHPIGVTVLCHGAVGTTIMSTSQSIVADSVPDGLDIRPRVTEAFNAAADLLTAHGRDPDEVGVEVVDAIRADRRFVLTDRTAETAIRRRAEDVIAAMPSGN